ncbi:MAG TPA: UDP binding domain-containing protein, partial [Polyangia bacterium]
KRLGGSVDGKTIAVWGLAFKPGTDDVREAPALTVIEKLLAGGARVHAHDPVANESAQKLLGDRIRYFDNNYDAADGADALALLTEWHQFRRPNFTRLKERMRGAHLFDGRNIWEPDEVRALGFTYEGIGRR